MLLSALAVLASLLAVAIAPSAASAVGAWQDPLFTPGQRFADVDFPTASHGWAVGVNGTILATDDSGVSWSTQASGTTQWLSGVSFADESNGWAVGGSTILRTSDGGAQWIEQAWAKPVDDVQLRSVSFSDANTGWVVGYCSVSGTWLGDSGYSAGIVLKTTDGGETWEQSPTPLADWAGKLLSKVACVDSGHAWALTDRGDIMCTKNGGGTWEVQPSESPYPANPLYRVSFMSIAFSDASHGWAAGLAFWLPNPDGTTSGMTIFATTDGGATWRRQAEGTTTGQMVDISFSADAMHGWAVGLEGWGGSVPIVYSTADGGVNWSGQYTGCTYYPMAISFPDVNHGWIVGDATGASGPGVEEGYIQAYLESAPVTYTVTASTGQGGTITPSGTQPVNDGDDIVFTITPDADYVVADVLVDGVSQGAIASYELTNVTANHAISAVFAPAPFWPNPDGWQFPNGSDRAAADDFAVWSRVFGAGAMESLMWEMQGGPVFNGGNCLGFAASSGLLFTGNLSLAEDFGLNPSYANPWDWGPGEPDYPEERDAQGDTVMDTMSKQAREEIEALQVCQFATPVDAELQAHKFRHPPPQFVADLQAALQDGPQLIAVSGTDRAGTDRAHALLAFDVERRGDWAFIGVYDCNHPGDPARYVELNLDAHTWSYDTGWTTWGTDQVGANWISWVSPETLKNVLESAPVAYYKPLAAGWGAGILQVVDAQGRVSGGDGVTDSWDIPGIQPFMDFQILPGASSDSGRSLVGPDSGGLTFQLRPDAAGSYAARFGRTESDLYLGMNWSDPAAAVDTCDEVTASPNGDEVTVVPATTSSARLAFVCGQTPPLALDAGLAPTTPGTGRLTVSTSDLPTGIAVSISDTGALADAPMQFGWRGGDAVTVDAIPDGCAEIDITGGAAAGQSTGDTTVTVRIDANSDGAWEQTTTSTLGRPSADPQEPFIPEADTAAPMTAAVGADADWQNAPVTVALIPTDNAGGSGMSGGSATTEYKLDAGAWTEGTGCTVSAPADHSNDGLHTVSYRSTDAAGNAEQAKSLTVKIDTTAPAASLSGVTNGAWYRSARALACTASDAGSGVKAITYTLDGAETTVPGASAALAVATLPNARHTLTWRATDAAGNASAAQTLSFAIDSSGPVTYAKATSGYRYRAIKLFYKIGDNLSPKATRIRIVVRNGAGKVVKTFTPTAKNRATWYYVKWAPRARGTYRYAVSARDLAGNAQRIRGMAKVVVR